MFVYSVMYRRFTYNTFCFEIGQTWLQVPWHLHLAPVIQSLCWTPSSPYSIAVG